MPRNHPVPGRKRANLHCHHRLPDERYDYDAEGVAETAICAQALPIPAFRQLLASSAAFRDFVFRAYGSRIADLLLLIEEVSFGRIDQRLAACLLQRARGQNA
jgi:CRP/FNR family transcriptional regulator